MTSSPRSEAVPSLRAHKTGQLPQPLASVLTLAWRVQASPTAVSPAQVKTCKTELLLSLSLDLHLWSSYLSQHMAFPSSQELRWKPWSILDCSFSQLILYLLANPMCWVFNIYIQNLFFTMLLHSTSTPRKQSVINITSRMIFLYKKISRVTSLIKHSNSRRQRVKAIWVGGVQLLSHARLFVISWTVARQAPLSVGFSRQKYWSGLPCPSPGDLPDPGIEPASPESSASTGGLFTTVPPGKPWKPQRGLLAPLWSSFTSFYSPTFMSVHPGSLAVLYMADLALIPNLCTGCFSAWNVLPSDPHSPSLSSVFAQMLLS